MFKCQVSFSYFNCIWDINIFPTETNTAVLNMSMVATVIISLTIVKSFSYIVFISLNFTTSMF